MKISFLLALFFFFHALMSLQANSISFFFPYDVEKIKPTFRKVRIIIGRIQKVRPWISYPNMPDLKQYPAPKALIYRAFEECSASARVFKYLSMLPQQENQESWRAALSFLNREKAWYCLTVALSHPVIEIRIAAARYLLAGRSRDPAPFILNVLEHNSFYIFDRQKTTKNMIFQRLLIKTLNRMTGNNIKSHRLLLLTSIRHGIKVWKEAILAWRK
ncbi:hypothetical protein ACFL35_20995 [Candidatus Riflebacteria bacterium]